jgi:quercetin dioxygenase-like cupin family protein
MPPPVRHSHIFKIFDELVPGDTLLVVNDHEPIHLVQFMKHERRDFDPGSYKAYQKGPKEWVGVFKKKKAGEPAQDDGVVITSFANERAYDEHAFSPVPIYSTNEYRVILTYFKAGQFIPVHKPNIDLVFLVQSGTGEVVARQSRQRIKPGDIIIIPKGQRRGIKAYSDMEALHLVSPPPNNSDHEEVVQKLKNGQFE